MDDSTFTIGEVATRAGLNVSAIRFYEAEGLLPEAPRVAGQRRYGDETLNRLGVIDVAKRAGFSLDDIRVLLDATDRGEPAHNRLQELAVRKLPEVDELIRRVAGVGDVHVCDRFDTAVGRPRQGRSLDGRRPWSRPHTARELRAHGNLASG